MGMIFISYRREDTEGQAGRLYDALVKEFGTKSIFLDVADIPVGLDFRKSIEQKTASCDVLLALMGKNWVNSKNAEKKRRLDDPSDFVRLEIVSALERNIPVIPVLVHGASMPPAGQLPKDCQNICYRNAIELTHVHWDSDVKILIAALNNYVRPELPIKIIKHRWIFFASIILLLMGLIIFKIFMRNNIKTIYKSGDTVYVCHLNPLEDNFLSLRDGPGSNYPEILRLGENTPLTILERRNYWYQVRKSDGTSGWVYSDWICLGEPP